MYRSFVCNWRKTRTILSTEARDWLKEDGFSSTAEYLIYMHLRLALKEGLFPHTNAGNLTKTELAKLQKTNVSMGLMLENVK